MTKCCWHWLLTGMAEVPTGDPYPCTNPRHAGYFSSLARVFMFSSSREIRPASRSPSNTVRRQRRNLPMSVGRASSHFRVVRQGYGTIPTASYTLKNEHNFRKKLISRESLTRLENGIHLDPGQYKRRLRRCGPEQCHAQHDRISR